MNQTKTRPSIASTLRIAIAGLALAAFTGVVTAQTLNAGASVSASAETSTQHKVYTGGGLFGFGGGDVAIKGYDPVAYFTLGEPTKGSDEFTAEWQATTWHFANAEHRELFVADPEMYAPQYGGFCAFAVAKGDLVKIDPGAWSIVDGKLYLNYSHGVQDDWQANRATFITRADSKWPALGKR